MEEHIETRIVKKIVHGDECWTVCCVAFEDGVAKMILQDAVGVDFESMDELLDYVDSLAGAIEYPALEYDDDEASFKKKMEE